MHSSDDTNKNIHGIGLSQDELQVFFGSARNDFMDFCIAIDRNYDPQFFHEEIAEGLQAVERGDVKFLMIEMPPRHGKSDEVSVKFPAWLLGKHPDWPIINASYSSDLSEKHSGYCRDIVRSDAFRNVFPGVQVKGDTKAKAYWQVERGRKDEKDFLTGGSFQAVGVGGAATGFGAKILIVDDPVKNREEADSEVMRQKVWDWYASVARTRLEKGGAVILIMTRWHEDDLAGRILATGIPVKRICFPAIAEQKEKYRRRGEALWPDKYPLQSLLDIRRSTDERTWYSLYQQQPKKSDKMSFDPSWFPVFGKEALKHVTCNRYAMIDVADTKKQGRDFTGVAVCDWSFDDKWYLQHLKRHRVNIKGLIDLIFWVWVNYHPLSIGIEKKSFADQVRPLLDDECVKRGIYPVVVELEHRGRSKEARILGALQGRAEHKRILLQENPMDDTDAFKEELWSFPRGRWDDLIDAVAYMEDIGQRPLSPAADPVVMNRRREAEHIGFN